jgi:hypothetical protein
MPSLGKSVAPCARDVTNTGMAQYSLAELMADPLIGLVMKRDGVDRRDLELLLEGVARERAKAIARPEVLAHTVPPIVKQSRIVYLLQAILSKVRAECTLLRRRKR